MPHVLVQCCQLRSDKGCDSFRANFRLQLSMPPLAVVAWEDWPLTFRASEVVSAFIEGIIQVNPSLAMPILGRIIWVLRIGTSDVLAMLDLYQSQLF